MESNRKSSVVINRRNRLFPIVLIMTLLLELGLLFRYSLVAESIVLYVCTIIVAVYLIASKFKMHVAGWWLYIYLFCSFLVVALFQYTVSMSTSSSNIQSSGFEAMARTTITIFFVLLLSMALFYTPGRNHKSIVGIYRFNISYSLFYYLAIILTTISFVLGLGRMGLETTRLPFHLTGIIRTYCTELFPLIALLEYSDLKNSTKRQKKSFLAGYTIWVLFECFVSLSKSALLYLFLPIVMFELLSMQRIQKSTIIKFVPIVLGTLLLFIIIPNVRSNEGSFSGAMQETTSKEIYGTNNSSFIAFPYTRTFYSGYLYLVDNYLIDENNLFDFSRAPMILLTGGSARYQTLIIDDYPEENHHSSGSSPFIDSLLIGGYGMFYITIILFTLLASKIDRKILYEKDYVIAAILCVFFYKIFDKLSISFIVDTVMMKWALVYVGIGLYVYYVRRKESKKISRKPVIYQRTNSVQTSKY